MSRKLFNAVMIVIMLIALPLSMGMAQTLPEDATPARPIGALVPTSKHEVAPKEEAVVNILEEEGALPFDATEEQREKAVQEYYADFQDKNPEWVNADVQEFVKARELDLSQQKTGLQADPEPERVSVQIFALAVDFGVTSESVPTTCPDPIVGNGPRVGNIAHPGPLDNNTIWYSPQQISNPDFYQNLIFGYQGVGRVRTDLFDPNDGQPGINLAGYTVQDYYDYMAGVGNVALNGLVEGWVTVAHSEAWYGGPSCNAAGVELDSDGGASGFVGDVVVDALNVFQGQHPDYFLDTSPTAFWPQFDANKDGIVDTMWIIHAGAGEEAGGGAEGVNAIWSHSWSLSVAYEGGWQVYEGDPATNADDIWVQPYTVQPEMTDLGVLVEEFGHNFFGWPDLYTTDVQNSIGFWSEMSGGSWGGWLGGSVPVGMTLWFRQIATCGMGPLGLIPCNWQYPMVVRDYQDPASTYTLGQLDGFPENSPGVVKGIQINIPASETHIANESGGTGKAAWSGTGVNDANYQILRDIAVPATEPVLSMQTYWEIEEGCNCDWAYVEVKGTADPAFITLDDMEAYFTNRGGGVYSLHEWAPAPTVLHFNLAPWAGQTVTLRLRYYTDPGYTDIGWWVDNLALNGTVFEDFETATAPATYPAGWTTAPEGGWKITPSSSINPKFYLVEWRSDSKYDEMMKTAYVTTYSDDDEWQVERVPYNIPAALVYFRDTTYGEGYSQFQYYEDPPSFGPKNKLLLVDMNPMGMRLFDPGGVYRGTLNNRSAAYDAGLTLQRTEAFSISSVFGLAYPGPFNFVSEPAVTKFNDANGYYPGFYYGSPCPAGNICYAGRDSSVVIPARFYYSTRFTDFAGNPLYQYYESPVLPWWFGSGNPGDDMVQYGININLLSKSTDNRTAQVKVYNYSVDAYTSVTQKFVSNGITDVIYETIVENVGTEVAKDVHLTYFLDPRLTFMSASVEVVDQPAPQGMAKVVHIDQIAPGQTMLVKIVTRYVASPGPAPTAPTTFETRWEMHDGQVERGPWWDWTNLTLFQPVYLPIMQK